MKNLKLFFLIFSIFSSVAYSEVMTLSATHPNAKYGVFSTYDLKVEPLNDGTRRVKLLEDLVFIDANGKKWTSPKGRIVDGATIPEAFQSIIGTPYGGQYVLASVIHDIAYDDKKASWQEVHQAFYDAMLASGVEERKAAIMYIAVYEASERWGANQNEHFSEEEIMNLVGSSDVGELLNMLNPLIENFDVEQFLLEMTKNIMELNGK